MLIHVTWRHAIVSKNRVVGDVRYNGEGKVPVSFKPLGAFPPIRKRDGGTHQTVVPAPADSARVVEGAEEALVGVDEVVVGGGEVE